MRPDHNEIAAVLALLAETWPKCFFLLEKRRKPLRTGIRDDILAVLDGAITPAELSAALACLCFGAGLRCSRLRRSSERQLVSSATPARRDRRDDHPLRAPGPSDRGAWPYSRRPTARAPLRSGC